MSRQPLTGAERATEVSCVLESDTGRAVKRQAVKRSQNDPQSLMSEAVWTAETAMDKTTKTLLNQFVGGMLPRTGGPSADRRSGWRSGMGAPARRPEGKVPHGGDARRPTHRRPGQGSSRHGAGSNPRPWSRCRTRPPARLGLVAQEGPLRRWFIVGPQRLL